MDKDVHRAVGEPTSTLTAGVITVEQENGKWKELRLPLLVGILIFSIYGFLRVLPNDPLLYSSLTKPFQVDIDKQQDEVVRVLRQKDPALGSVLPLPAGIVTRTASVPAAHNILLVMISSCSGCMAGVLHDSDAIHSKYPGLVVVAVSPSETPTIRDYCKQNRLKLNIISDPEQQFSQRYNGAWTPRAYLLKSDGTLLWMQTHWRYNRQDIEQALRQAQAGGTR